MPESTGPREAGVESKLSEIVASGWGSTFVGGFTEVLGLTGGGGGGVGTGASEMVAPSSGSNGVLPAELSPLAGTPTPCGPNLSRPPLLDLGSSMPLQTP